MSISPQSLARTRDKRNLRIPRKFEDFSLVTSGDVPTDTSHIASKNFAEALKLKGKPAKRQTFGGSSSSGDQATGTVLDSKSKKETNEASISPADNSSPSPIESQNSAPHSRGSSASKIKSPSPPAASTTILPDQSATPSPPTKRPPPKQRNPMPAPIDPPIEIEKNDEEHPLPLEIDLECKESTSAYTESLFNEKSRSKRCKTSQDLSESEDEEEVGDSTENLDCIPTITTTTTTTTKSSQQTNQPIQNTDGNNIVKKSPFQLTMTISNGIRISGPFSKPLNTRRLPKNPFAEPLRTTRIHKPQNLSSSDQAKEAGSKTATRKKARGFSLMLKPPANGPSQANNVNCNNMNNSINGTVNRSNITQQQQPTKYYNNMSQGMQYGTRLMLNEPIYLPRSVASIAPITTTLQQIANQARKPPFLSKKAEAYMAYQDERKFDYISSSYTVLQKITKYLEVQDLLNLRLVNKTWKSIIDSDACWKKVEVKESKIVDWVEFVNLLAKYKTTDLYLNEFTPCVKNSDILNVLCGTRAQLKRIWIRTVDEVQNKFAVELACFMNLSAARRRHDIRIIWHVKVMIDECGLALVPIQCKDPRISKTKAIVLLYCYTKLPKLIGERNKVVLVELSDLEDLFNGGKYDRSKERRLDSSSCTLRVDMKPI